MKGTGCDKDEMGQMVVCSNLIAGQFYTYEIVYGSTSYNICWSIKWT